MSLIEEALCRVKDPLVPPSSMAKAPRKAASAQTPATTHSWPTASAPSVSQPATPAPAALLTMVTIAILGLTAALIFGGAIWMWRTMNGNARVESAMMAPDTASPRTQPASTIPSVVSTNSPYEFNLTGIVEGSGEPYAVINGSIVAAGETVGTATLVNIGQGTVTLRLANGKETVLRVSR